MAEELKAKQLISKINEYTENNNIDMLCTLLDQQRTSRIAEVMELLEGDRNAVILGCLPKEESSEVFEKLDEATRAELYELLNVRQLKTLIYELDPDDAADILSELPPSASEHLLRTMKPDESETIKNLMQYSDDSAGGIMDPLFLSVPKGSTVHETIELLKIQESDEDFYAVYVVDIEGVYLGDVRIRNLFSAEPEQKIEELIEESSLSVSVFYDQEEIKNIFSKNDLIAVPVVDGNNVLVGRITADRVLEVAEEEAAEDIYTIAGTDAEELYDTSIFRAARIRMTWLAPCLIGTGVTAMVLLFFKNSFTEVYTVAAAFAPMIAAISGNAGLQTSAVVICGLATGHMAALNLGQVFMREARIALLIAMFCGLIGGLIYTGLSDVLGNHDPASGMNYVMVSLAFGIAMSAAVMVSTTLGLFLPFLFKKIGIDPAISSGPLVTTANDSISVSIYLFTTLAFLG
ncbi:Magnesium transporter MgtE [Sedimentisphaera cyanobacteriorum]|uniref:Magnesium transporter MgtE n=1 Tax=Sedimentisphaera cyanobacteriorum TaxID=1940790 RepID=A0A1Q2HM56_9BACT|nr:magnesium transporter [Sedimentisphaera cyanobacteriorum]AQQ08296.1 Magnesium transporter MgtE [Sedimentisphaera cyanobacteriorum]